MKTVLIIKLKMSPSPPTVFHTQSPSSRQCVRIALSNAMQKTHTISCQSFQNEVKTIEEGAGSVIANFYNNLYDKKPKSDNCPCWQENWSLTVALEYLKDHKMKGDEIEIAKANWEKGHFLILAKNIGASGNHALAVVDGWLLDSLSDRPVRFQENFDTAVSEKYKIMKVWEIKDANPKSKS